MKPFRLRRHRAVHCAGTRAFGEYFDPDHVPAVNTTLETYVSNLATYHCPPVGDREAYRRGLSFNVLDGVAARRVPPDMLEFFTALWTEAVTAARRAGARAAAVDRCVEAAPFALGCERMAVA